MGYRNDINFILRVENKTLDDWFLELLLQEEKKDLYKRIMELYTSNYKIKDTPSNILHVFWEQVKWYGEEESEMDQLISLLEGEGVDACYSRLGDEISDIVTNYSNEGYELGYVSRNFVPNYKE